MNSDYCSACAEEVARGWDEETVWVGRLIIDGDEQL